MVSVKWLVGLGFWVQGFRCLPWLGVSFYLKDGLHLPPSALQLLQNSATLPTVVKPLIGLLSDAHGRRIPYLAIGALLQAISWLAIALLPESSVTIATATFFLLLSYLGASVVDVANDAIVAEVGKQPQSASGSGQLQAFVSMAASSAGVIGNLLGGVMIKNFSPRIMFLLFGILLAVQFLATISVPESSLNLPKKPSHCSITSSIRKQLSELSAALSKPEIFYSLAWFSASYALIPTLLGTMFFYQTQHLKLDSSVIAFSRVFGQAALLAWSVVYNKKLKRTPARRILSALQVTTALFMVSDILFVKGIYREMGIPDSVYVVLFSGLLEALYMCKILPFTVLIAQVCPSGCEGSIMAFAMSACALAFIVSAYLGVGLATIVRVSENDFSGLPTGLLVQAVCTVLPIFLSSWIPNVVKSEEKKE